MMDEIANDPRGTLKNVQQANDKFTRALDGPGKRRVARGLSCLVGILAISPTFHQTQNVFVFCPEKDCRVAVRSSV
jgi:hypothetical protein